MIIGISGVSWIGSSGVGVEVELRLRRCGPNSSSPHSLKKVGFTNMVDRSRNVLDRGIILTLDTRILPCAALVRPDIKRFSPTSDVLNAISDIGEMCISY